MPGTEHQHDDVTLRPDERLRLGSIVAGWDEEVRCDFDGWVGLPDEPCEAAAEWIAHPGCGHPALNCTEHRMLDDDYDWVCDCGHQEYEPLTWHRL